MSLHPSTFGYLKPTEKQVEIMTEVRSAFGDLADILQQKLPDGPDKTYTIRHLRETAMWANVAITREQNGEPRQ